MKYRQVGAYISRVYRLSDWNAHPPPGKVRIFGRNLPVEFGGSGNLGVDLTHQEYRHENFKGVCAGVLKACTILRRAS